MEEENELSPHRTMLATQPFWVTIFYYFYILGSIITLAGFLLGTPLLLSSFFDVEILDDHMAEHLMHWGLLIGLILANTGALVLVSYRAVKDSLLPTAFGLHDTRSLGFWKIWAYLLIGAPVTIFIVAEELKLISVDGTTIGKIVYSLGWIIKTFSR